MKETIITDAFYHVHTEVFARENRCYERVFTKIGCEEAIEDGVYFVPDLCKISRKEWKIIKSSLRNVVEFGTFTTRSTDYAFCPHFFSRGEKLVNDEKYLSYIEAIGNFAPRGVLPTKFGKAYFIMSQESTEEFLGQGFTGVACQPLVSEETYFPDEKIETLIRGMNLIHIRFGSYMGDQTLLRELHTLSPGRCERCGGSIYFCFDCGVEPCDCPHCGKRALSSEEKYNGAFVKLWVDVSQNVPVIWFHYRDNWRVLHNMHPWRGEKWCGNDFFSYGSFAVCTGRAAKWFIENQFGYIGLSPMFVDVSNCSEEQRERIEAVRYSPFRR